MSNGPEASKPDMARSWMPLPVWAWGEDGRKIVAWAKVSPEDWPKLRRYQYWLTDGYPARTLRNPDGSKTTILLHREVLGVENGDPVEVDHINRDRLDARRENIRECSRWQNEGNKPRPDDYTSKRVGVTRVGTRWKAQASYDGEYVYLGMYDTEDGAIAARERWESKYRTEDRSAFMPEPQPKSLPSD